MIIPIVLFLPIVKAETCTNEEQIKVNNAAGLVNVKAYPFSYTVGGVDETEEEPGKTEYYDTYMGMIDIYNVTEDIYVVLSGNGKKASGLDRLQNGRTSSYRVRCKPYPSHRSSHRVPKNAKRFPNR